MSLAFPPTAAPSAVSAARASAARASVVSTSFLARFTASSAVWPCSIFSASLKRFAFANAFWNTSYVLAYSLAASATSFACGSPSTEASGSGFSSKFRAFISLPWLIITLPVTTPGADATEDSKVFRPKSSAVCWSEKTPPATEAAGGEAGRGEPPVGETVRRGRPKIACSTAGSWVATAAGAGSRLLISAARPAKSRLPIVGRGPCGPASAARCMGVIVSVTPPTCVGFAGRGCKPIWSIWLLRPPS